MLVNASDMLKNAEAGHYALGAFNTNNLEWTLAILQAAEEAKSPLIMQCTGGAAKWMGSYKVCADMVKACVEALDITVPVALHLDHGSYEDCFKAMDAGFTSIMYDGSRPISTAPRSLWTSLTLAVCPLRQRSAVSAVPRMA